jgi:hypothetical protein
VAGAVTYARVIPRDLFNEGNLLTCLGRLWIKLDDRRDHGAVLIDLSDRDGRFLIEQEDSDGTIFTPSVRLEVDGGRVPMFRPLNARGKWPLWVRDGDEDRRVFDEDGELSPEFWVMISQPELARQRRERA